MDNLKKTRGAKRSAFTRTYNGIMILFEDEGADPDAIKSNFAILRDKATELQELDDRILTLMQDDAEVTEEDMSTDINVSDEYQMKYQQIKQHVTRRIQPVFDPAGLDATNNPNITHAVNQTLVDNSGYRLPKMNVPIFNGEIKDWLPFWSIFKNIDGNDRLKPEEKFHFLRQAMVKSTRAYEVVNSFPPTTENYPKAIESLKNRFGKKELQVEVYVRELLMLVLHNTSGTKEPMSITSIYDKLETHLRALESLDVTTEMCAAMLYPLVESALPEDTLRAWQRHPTATAAREAKGRLEALMKFLQSEVETEQRIELASGGFGINNTSQKKSKKDTKANKDSSQKSTHTGLKSVATAAGLIAAEDSSSSQCIFCCNCHDSADCEAARKMSYADRSKIAQDKNACFYCLKVGHGCKKCRFQKKCSWCSRRHVLLMCREMSGLSTNPKPPDKADEKNKEHNLASLTSEPEIFLQTLRVKIVNGNQEKIVRAIVDHGSHRSYILGSLAEQMGYEVAGTKTMAHSLFGGSQTVPSEHKCYKIHLRSLDGNYACNYQAYHQEVICQDVHPVSSGSWLSDLRQRSIKLSDVGTRDHRISLLIGADIAGKLYTGQLFDLECGATAMETRLGWTLIGKNNNSSRRSDPALLSVSMFTHEASVSKLWSLDVIGITDPIEQKSKEAQQQQALKKFQETLYTDDSGRYVVNLPWKESHPPLPFNRTTAQRRLQNTQRKLAQDGLLADYEKIFEDWLADGIIEVVPEEEIHKKAYYLPHRHVVKEGSSTRIRPVFDASAREKESVSLNQCLEPGPNLIELIPTLLLRFRENPVGIIADIKKAFLQISVSREDRDVLRFLWKTSHECSKEIEYRHCRVVFGVTSSPFLLGATIDFHLEEAIKGSKNQEERDILIKLKSSFYVDNCIASVNSPEEATTFQKIATSIMSAGGFDLRAWEYSKDLDSRQISPVLGLLWDKKADVLRLVDDVLTPKLPDKITKRTILSITQKVFDPVGMASPTILIPKLLLQDLWQTELDWDTEVPENVKLAFTGWCQELPLLRELEIHRWAFGDTTDKLTLHLFVDASREAYAAVIYARTESADGVKVEFVESKTRVAPKERATIPRLELLAATVGARLLHSVTSVLCQRQVEVHCWSDSTTALAWIKQDLQWATFVFNRVQEIRRLTEPTCWRHVPGEMNPADLPSRGCRASHLVRSNWIDGPEWLKLPEQCWPSSSPDFDEVLVHNELRKTPIKTPRKAVATQVLGNLSVRVEDSIWYLRRFSNYSSILRLVAWVQRFISNCRRKKNNRVQGTLTPKEIEAAEYTILRLSQQDSFTGLEDPRLKCMMVYEDRRGLIRLKSIVENRQDTENFRHPVVLDYRHPAVIKLIEHLHLTSRHAPIDTVMSILREKVWILQCRRAVRSVVNHCVTCRRYNAKKMQPKSVALPEDRVKDAAVFEVTGVDFTGPLFLKDGSKAWVCLFTCAVYRAVHLELVSSLSTEIFMEALRRFIARRGRPSVIYADNGTNFKGASNQLRKIYWKKVVESSVNEIQWKFNPPSAPWWGGFWERLIRIMKDLLRKTLKKASLSYEELSTVLCDCEAIINSRPLTHLSEDPQQLVPLTPNAFLQDVKEVGVPDVDAVDANSLNRRQKYLQQLREHLRQRFRSEYLGQLQRRATSGNSPHEIKVGDIVFCGNDLQKRLDWPLARVVQTCPGKDGQVRVVKLKTATGELTRALQRLYPLEIPGEKRLELLDKYNVLPTTAETLVEQPETEFIGEAERSPDLRTADLVGEPMLSAEVDSVPVKTTPETTTRRGRVVKLPSRFRD